MGVGLYFLIGLFWTAAVWVAVIATWIIFVIKEIETDGGAVGAIGWLTFLGGLVVGAIWPISLFIVFWSILAAPVVFWARARHLKAKAKKEAAVG